MPGFPVQADRVLSDTVIHQLISPLLGYDLVSCYHQQIRVGQAIPVPSCSGAKQVNLVRQGCAFRRGHGEQRVNALFDVGEPLRMALLAQRLKAVDASHASAVPVNPFWACSAAMPQQAWQ